jgi:hypothetical protein
MKSLFRHAHLLQLGLLASTSLLLSGCSSHSSGEGAFASSWNEVVQRAARAEAVGRAYDRSLLSARREDIESMAQHGTELERAGGSRLAKGLAPILALAAIREASRLDLQAQEAHGELKKTLRKQSTKYYRTALHFEPRYDVSDPYSLNSLGYFLAEGGTSAADFKEAERLTRRAIELLDKDIAETAANTAARNALEYDRATIRDSLAWALFRQNRLDEARREQERAVADALKVLPTLGLPAKSMEEWHFHLGEIYRAMKLYELSRRQYESALKLDPDDAASRAALQSLSQEAPQLKTSPASRGGETHENQ